MKKVFNRLFNRTDSTLNILSRASQEQIEILINEILDNAFLLIKDANTLIEQNKSYGHAFGLLALACEEIAKANMVIYKGIDQNGKHPFTNHTSKQKNLAMLTFARYIPIYIKEGFESKIDPNIHKDRKSLDTLFDENLNEFLEIMESDPEFNKRFIERQEFFGRLESSKRNGEEITCHTKGHLNELREYAFYVDVISNTELMTPKQIPKEYAISIKSITEEDLYYTDLYYNKGRIINKYQIKKPSLPLVNEKIYEPV